MNQDFAFIVFNEGERHAVEQRVFSCKGVKRQEVAAGEVTRSGVAERVGRKQNALFKLVAQSVLGHLIDSDQHHKSQEQQDARKGAADFPLEADAS
jgi:hypothetical protein